MGAPDSYIDIDQVGLEIAGHSLYESLSLAISESEFFFLLGPSGCGKSTLLRLIAGLLEPSSGRIHIGGQATSEAWRDIAFVFQSPRLVGWRNALDNVTLGAQLRQGGSAQKYRDKAAELLTRLGLEHDMHKLPAMLSGGERQRVAIARAFLLDPPIILMDEPFSALDLKTREHLRTELEQLWRVFRKTVVFVTHDIDDALSLADRIVVLGPKPTRILDTIHVAQERPRTLASPSLRALRAQLEKLLTH